MTTDQMRQGFGTAMGRSRQVSAYHQALYKAANRIDAQQARIDALMLEYCPDEMTPEQIAEYERHQKAVPNAEITGRTMAHNEADGA